MHLSINTSGRLDSKYRALLISQNPDCVVVSLDGIKEVHDKVRAEGAYNLSLSLLDDLKKNNIVKRINCVLSKETMPFIENVVQEAHLAKCCISFIPLRTMGKETEYKKSAALSKKEMLSCVEQITKLRLQYEDVPIETFFDILGGTFTAHHMMNFNSPCPAGKNGFVAADGTFFPCDWIRYLGDRFNCGSVIDQGLKNIWEKSDGLHKFQCISRKKCLECDHYLSRCYGGCWCSYTDTIDSEEYEDKLCPVTLFDAFQTNC